jgi:MoxR-like ATPase
LILIQAAKGWAYIHGRKMVLPDDIQAVAQAVMNHRLNPQHMKVEDVIQSVAIP